jgi:hypothetical protein
MLYKTIIPFIRQEVDGVKTIAIVEFTTSQKQSQRSLIRSLTEIITYWTKETDEGKKVLANNNGDFNIGDYALYEVQIHDRTPHSVYTQHSIQDIKILYNGEVTGSELYDRVLVA